MAVLAIGKDDTGEQTGRILTARNPGLTIAGCYSPPFGFEKDPAHFDAMIEKIEQARPDIVFVAHTGTEHLTSLGEIWRSLPLGDKMTARYWRIPAAERPTEHDASVAWLFEWWAEIDRWIAEEKSAT